MKKGSTGRKTGKIVNCANCGKEIYRYPRDLKRRSQHFCSYKCMGNLMSRENIGIKNSNWRGGIHVYGDFVRSSRARRLVVDITKDEYESFRNAKCYYCNSQIDGVRLDRVDNTMGYFMENIVPCCKICNYMKMGLSIVDFLDHIKLIYNRVLSE